MTERQRGVIPYNTGHLSLRNFGANALFTVTDSDSRARNICRVPILAYEAWQCGGGFVELTERVPLLHMDFQRAVHSLTGAAEARVQQNGTCHAVLLWMDYYLDPEGKIQVRPADLIHESIRGTFIRRNMMETTLMVYMCVVQDSTGLQENGMSSWRQGVVLLPEPVEVCSQHAGTDGTANSLRRTALRIDATFDGATADISIGLLEFM